MRPISDHRAGQEAEGNAIQAPGDALVQRLQRYEYGLRGARGAVIAAGVDQLSRATFLTYHESRDIDHEFPGALIRETLALAQADSRSCAIEASLSRLGDRAEQITTLVLREVTQRGRPAPAPAAAGGPHPPELRT